MKLNKKSIAAVLAILAALVLGAQKLLEKVPDEILPDVEVPTVSADAGV